MEKSGSVGQAANDIIAYLRLQVHTWNNVMPTAFPLQQWLQQCASLLRYTYIACLVNLKPFGTESDH